MNNRCTTIASLLVIFYVTLECFVSFPVYAQAPPGQILIGIGGGGSNQVPMYYFGTNCKASWGAQTTNMYLTTMPPYNNPMYRLAYIANVKIYVQDQLAFNMDFPDTHRNSQDGSITFDSTHFGDGTVATIKVVATDNTGATATGLSPGGLANVYNKAFVLGNNTLGSTSTQAAVGVGQRTTVMDYGTVSSDSRRSTNILSLIANFTLFFIDSHGNPNVIADCYNSGGSTGIMSDYEISTSNASKGMLPQYQFVHLDTCNSGGSYVQDSTDLSNAFGIVGQDTAFLGWKTEVVENQANLEWTLRFYDNLSSGETVWDAYVTAQALGIKQAPSSDNNGFATVAVYGDTYTKIHGVYGGYNLQWCLPW